jgi:hypothetical protein
MAKDEQSHGCQSKTQTHDEYGSCVVTGNPNEATSGPSADPSSCMAGMSIATRPVGSARNAKLTWNGWPQTGRSLDDLREEDFWPASSLGFFSGQTHANKAVTIEACTDSKPLR